MLIEIRFLSLLIIILLSNNLISQQGARWELVAAAGDIPTATHQVLTPTLVELGHQRAVLQPGLIPVPPGNMQLTLL